MSSEDRRELRRPVSGVGSHHRNGSSVDQSFQTVEDIEEGIRMLAVDDDSTSFESAKDVAINIHSFCADNSNILKELVAFLHEKCLESSAFASRASFVFAALGQFEVAGIKFRDVLLRRIQADFMGREDRRRNDRCKFLNSIATLCFIFRRVRLADGATIKILATPIISYLKMLLENSFDEEIEILGTQLQIVGSELSRHEPGQLDSLLLNLRQKLTCSDASGLTSQSRTHLVLVLELYLLGWPRKLSDPVEAFYSKSLPKRGRCPLMPASLSNVDSSVGVGVDRDGNDDDDNAEARNTHLFIEKSPMLRMNLAALASQMSSTLQQYDDDDTAAATSSSSSMHHGWCKDPEMWPSKDFSRPPPQIINPQMNISGLQGSMGLSDYSNLRPNNLRR